MISPDIRQRLARLSGRPAAAAPAQAPQAPQKPTNFYIRGSVFASAGPQSLVAEASECKLAPGEWPEVFETQHSIGNGQPFKLTKVRPDGARVYWQVLGAVQIVILND